MRTVRVPSVEAEDERQLHRELEQLTKERGAHLVRIQSLLFAHGIRISACPTHVRMVLQRTNEIGLPADLVSRLTRELARFDLVDSQVKAIMAERQKRLKANLLSDNYSWQSTTTIFPHLARP